FSSLFLRMSLSQNRCTLLLDMHWPLFSFHGKRLAGAGRRNQQRAFAGLGAGEQFKLMGARAPALFRKPEGKGGRKQCAGFGIDLVHALKLVKSRG
ncbi:hypothetical protein ACC672_36740, partial [Rhizobium ruizarguesonis]